MKPVSGKAMCKVLQRLGWGMQMQTLTIVGHGNEGRMNVGCASTPDWSGEKMLYVDYQLADEDLKLFGPAEVHMNRLRGRFAGGPIRPVVTLGGCLIMKDPEKGRRLLMAVSRALGGVHVQAGDDVQFDLKPGIEGNCVRCNEWTCWTAPAYTDYHWWGPT